MQRFAVGEAGVTIPAAASPPRSCKIFGIGGAKCIYVLASLRFGVELVNSQWMLELICIDH